MWLVFRGESEMCKLNSHLHGLKISLRFLVTPAADVQDLQVQLPS